MEAVESFEHFNLKIEIHQDSDPLNPRKEWDCHTGTMVCWHRRYDLGDKKWNESDEFEKAVMSDQVRWNRVTCENEYKYDYFERKDMELPPHGTLDKDYLYLPLYLYDHSGITMSTGKFSCPWDSGQVGFIYVRKDKVRAEYGWKVLTEKRREIVIELLRNEVKTYDQYLTGDVYGFTIKDAEGNDIDSCWGYFGMEEVRTAARESAECHGKRDAEEEVHQGTEKEG